MKFMYNLLESNKERKWIRIHILLLRLKAANIFFCARVYFASQTCDYKIISFTKAKLKLALTPTHKRNQKIEWEREVKSWVKRNSQFSTSMRHSNSPRNSLFMFSFNKRWFPFTFNRYDIKTYLKVYRKFHCKVLCNRQPTPKMVNAIHARKCIPTTYMWYRARGGRRNTTEREIYYYKIIKTGKKAKEK